MNVCVMEIACSKRQHAPHKIVCFSTCFYMLSYLEMNMSYRLHLHVMMKYAPIHDYTVDHALHMFESMDRNCYSTTGALIHLDLVRRL